MTKMATKKLGKYMLAELVEQKPKTQVWNILNKKSLELLGSIAWYSPWRQYCFFVEKGGVIFNHRCLNEISDFLFRLNCEHRMEKVCAIIALSGGGYVSPRKLLKMSQEELDRMTEEIRNARKQGIFKNPFDVRTVRTDR